MHIVILIIAGIALLLAILYTAGSRLIFLFEKYNNTPCASQVDTISLLYFFRSRLGLDFDIKRIAGKLTDCYVPSKKVIALSDETFSNNSLSAVVVVSHEIGHAVQHTKHRFWFNLYRLLGGIFSLLGGIAVPAVIASAVLTLLAIEPQIASILLFSGLATLVSGFLFKLFTIPLEYSASNIAINILTDFRVISPDQVNLARQITNAAAFTYVAEFIKDILGLNLLKRR